MLDPETPPPTITELKIDQEVVKRSVLHTNVAQEFLVTTTDKARLCLRDFEDALKKRREWSTPLGICVTVAATLLSADFKTAYGLSPQEWKALFMLGSVMSGLWLVVSVIRAFSSNGTSIDSIIERLKQQSGQQ